MTDPTTYTARPCPAQPSAAEPKPKAKRKWPRRATPAKPQESREFAGLTATNCCDACRPTRCVISGSNVCAHPFKGLQASLQGDDAVMRRRLRAEQALGDAKVHV